jgi:hypothetical protein
MPAARVRGQDFDPGGRIGRSIRWSGTTRHDGRDRGEIGRRLRFGFPREPGAGGRDRTRAPRASKRASRRESRKDCRRSLTRVDAVDARPWVNSDGNGYSVSVIE